MKLKIAAYLLTVYIPDLSNAACTITINPGDDLRGSIANAAAGSTLCLNSGKYPETLIEGVNKGSVIVIQSSTAQGAQVSFDIKRSSKVKLMNLTISGLYISNQAKELTIAENKFVGQTIVNMGSNGGNYGNANIVFDRNSFDNISVCANCYEGRVQVISDLPSGVTFTNNHFGGPGESDGIQLAANGVVIGPGNIFDGIVQGNYGRHVDSIQGYGQKNTKIYGNYFINNDIQIMMPDGGSGEIITHNVFIASKPGNNGIQLGSHANDSFIHNTVKNITVNIDKKSENPTKSTNAIVRDNIMINSFFKTKDTAGVESCNNCTFENNLFNSSTNAVGTNNIIGTPAFVGGPSPTSWVGWKLMPSTLGTKKATDGADLGANVFGEETMAIKPSAPKNLRFLEQ